MITEGPRIGSCHKGLRGGMAVRKGRWAIGLLVLFLAGEFWIHGSRTSPALGMEGSSWTSLARGPYEAPPGRFGGVDVLLPEAAGDPVLAAEQGAEGPMAVPAVPERILHVKGFGRVELWGKKEPRLATLTVNGATERLPLAPDGSAVLLVGGGGHQIYRLALHGRRAKPVPLLAKRIGGVDRTTFEAKVPEETWAPIWAEAPFFGSSADVVYYFSNRLETPGSPSMELWSLNMRNGKNTLLETGNGLATFGVDARGRVILANASGQVLAVTGRGSHLLGTGLRPFDLTTGGLRLLVEHISTGKLSVLDLVSDRLEAVPLGGAHYAGEASFSPDGSALAVAVTTRVGAGAVRIFHLTPSGVEPRGEAAPPTGKSLVLDAPISWLDADHLVLVLSDVRARLSTWIYGGAKGL